jgi:hypothetical protein
MSFAGGPSLPDHIVRLARPERDAEADGEQRAGDDETPAIAPRRRRE